MALSWLLHSTYTIVLGFPKDTGNKILGYPNEEGGIQGIAKSTKLSEDDGLAQVEPTPGFQMPLHYPRYRKGDYEKMEEWKVDMLLKEYGLSFKGTLDEKRTYAMGAFLWPDQL
ncbi:uncharacterized protein LOC132271951 [Cornus florida]|uniref:uncharacterized protein LOC132271951 n=1 Tax=Cornus florida TaxID=4283 RepID=UPI00289EEFBC|nr:uncharacterized protein LOC132271951 [Cornus florida]